MNKQEVLDEIGRIKEMNSVDTTTPGWFELRTHATKNLLSQMTDAEKADLRKEGDKMAEKGLPEDVKRR